jgi:hypothetical protein
MKTPKMTRAHFVFIADVIAQMPTFSARLRTQQRETAYAFADAFAETNPLFDREKFLYACDLQEEE